MSSAYQLAASILTQNFQNHHWPLIGPHQHNGWSWWWWWHLRPVGRSLCFPTHWKWDAIMEYCSRNLDMQGDVGSPCWKWNPTKRRTNLDDTGSSSSGNPNSSTTVDVPWYCHNFWFSFSRVLNCFSFCKIWWDKIRFKIVSWSTSSGQGVMILGNLWMSRVKSESRVTSK